MLLGEKLLNLRKAKGLSQEQLAAQITVSRQAISKWELGESKPDIENIIQISQIFGVSTDYLLLEKEASEIVSPSKDQGHNNHVLGQILLIASTAFLAIGLLATFGSWYANQNNEDIWGGMIIQVVGVVAYFMAKVFDQAKVPSAFTFLNIALGVFMPISMVVSVIRGGSLTPYPVDILAGGAFAIAYVVVMLITAFILRRPKIDL